MKFFQGRRIEPRLSPKVEANLLVDLLNLSANLPQTIPVIVTNLNTTGISINCGQNLSVFPNLMLELRVPPRTPSPLGGQEAKHSRALVEGGGEGENLCIRVPVKIVWQKDNDYGLDFIKLRGIDYRRLQNIIEIAEKDGKGSVLDRRKTYERRREILEEDKALQKGEMLEGNPPFLQEAKRSRPLGKGDIGGLLSEKRANQRRLNLPLFKLFIDGRDVDTGRYEFFPYADKHIAEFKKTREIISQLRKGQIPPNYAEYVHAAYCIGNNEHVEQAIDASHRASEIFRKFPLATRLNILKDIHTNLLKEKENLLKLFVIEGHPRKLAEWEFSGMAMLFRSKFISYYKTLLRKTVMPKTEIVIITHKADGVVYLCPPANASASNSLTAGFSFLSGNALIVKPPLHVPLTTIYLWRNIVYSALLRNGAPPGILNIILGDSKKIMEDLLRSPKVNTVYFFGESKIGMEIGCRVFASGKKPILELSGNDFMVVWKDANIKLACQSLLDGFLGSTQICMVPKKALIHESIYDKFEKLFLKEVAKIKVGLPSDPETFLVPVVKIEEFMNFYKDALNKGAILLCGGKRINHYGQLDKRGVYIQPTVIRVNYGADLPDMLCIQEENFFPLMPLIRVASTFTPHPNPLPQGERESKVYYLPQEERGSGDGERQKDLIIFEKMMYALNANKYGLRTSIWIKSGYFLRRFIREIKNSGLIRVNLRHVGFSPCLATHGGTGLTGGPFGEMNYIWQKTSHLQGISIGTLYDE